jgi:hypothetical protein
MFMVFWDTTLGGLPDREVSEERDASSFRVGIVILKK